MTQKIAISIAGLNIEAELYDTPCAQGIAAILPIETTPNEWGDEFYFRIPCAYDLDQTATTQVKAGDIGYWPPGRAVAIFFGPTPMSTGPDPVPASAVNIIGKITSDPTELKKTLGSNSLIRLDKA